MRSGRRWVAPLSSDDRRYVIYNTADCVTSSAKSRLLREGIPVSHRSPGRRSSEIFMTSPAGVQCIPHRRQRKKHIAYHMGHLLTKFDVPASYVPTVRPAGSTLPNSEVPCDMRHEQRAPLKSAKAHIRLVGLCTIRMWSVYTRYAITPDI